MPVAIASTTRSRVSRRSSECSPLIAERFSIKARRSLLALIAKFPAAARKFYRSGRRSNNDARQRDRQFKKISRPLIQHRHTQMVFLSIGLSGKMKGKMIQESDPTPG